MVGLLLEARQGSARLGPIPAGPVGVAPRRTGGRGPGGPGPPEPDPRPTAFKTMVPATRPPGGCEADRPGRAVEVQETVIPGPVLR
jgi:hypothetical protein